MEHEATTGNKPKTDSSTSGVGAEASPAEEPVRCTVTHLGSYTVLSNAYAKAHPDIAARVAEQNAAFETLMQEARAS